MIELRNSDLSVSVLEPARDTARLGARYCSGGYVWQVRDEVAGDLCSGPCFPDPEPPPFDGQGLPEVFEIALGQDRARRGADVYVIGVGRVRRESEIEPFHVRDNPRVIERALWELTESATELLARTSGAFEGYGFELSRRLALAGRTLDSSTELRNHGGRAIPLRWFAHPFFPWPNGDCCRLSLEHALAPDAPLAKNERGFLERRAASDWQAGHYLVPRVALGGELRVEQRHPKLDGVEVTCRFPLGWLALWGNTRTFSIEPFFQTVLAPGASVAWGIAYRFGVPTTA